MGGTNTADELGVNSSPKTLAALHGHSSPAGHALPASQHVVTTSRYAKSGHIATADHASPALWHLAKKDLIDLCDAVTSWPADLRTDQMMQGLFDTLHKKYAAIILPQHYTALLSVIVGACTLPLEPFVSMTWKEPFL
eukprot:5707951-Karenia_brevis.AAC.1